VLIGWDLMIHASRMKDLDTPDALQAQTFSPTELLRQIGVNLEDKAATEWMGSVELAFAQATSLFKPLLLPNIRISALPPETVRQAVATSSREPGNVSPRRHEAPPPPFLLDLVTPENLEKKKRTDFKTLSLMVAAGGTPTRSGSLSRLNADTSPTNSTPSNSTTLSNGSPMNPKKPGLYTADSRLSSRSLGAYASTPSPSKERPYMRPGPKSASLYASTPSPGRERPRMKGRQISSTTSFSSMPEARKRSSRRERSRSPMRRNAGDQICVVLSIVQQELLQGANVLHCAAVLAAVQFTAWAVKEPSFAPLLMEKDAQGLTPLAVACKCQADLLRPLFAPEKDQPSSSSGRIGMDGDMRDQILEKARRFHSVISVLRLAQPAAVFKQYLDLSGESFDGLALCIAHEGATSIKEPRRLRRIPTTTSTTNLQHLRHLNSRLSMNATEAHNSSIGSVGSPQTQSSTSSHGSRSLPLDGMEAKETRRAEIRNSSYHDVTQHLLLYKLVVHFQTKLQRGQLVLSGSMDRFYSQNMYLACGWALSFAELCKVMVPMTQDGFRSLLHSLKFSKSLLVLDLSGVGLTGNIPSSLGEVESLTYVDLSDNTLTGEVPASIGSLQHLRGFSAKGNQLTGQIAEDLVENSKSLVALNLYDNLLSGELPASLWYSTHLQEIWLNNNSLKMFLPVEMGQLSNLVSLVLTDNQIYGPIPSSIKGLKHLELLSLQSNRLTGELPLSLCELTSLTSLSISRNQLQGPIPMSFSRLTLLQHLHMGDNKLTGPVPPTLGALSRLETLKLHNNCLAGDVPMSLSSLVSIRQLTLHGNPRVKSKARSSKQLARLIAASKLTLRKQGQSKSSSSRVRRRTRPAMVSIITLDPDAELTEDAEIYRV